MSEHCEICADRGDDVPAVATIPSAWKGDADVAVCRQHSRKGGRR